MECADHDDSARLVEEGRPGPRLRPGTLRPLRAELMGQARQALEDGREDLAREALARGAVIDRQLAELVAQRDCWQAEADRFTAACERLTREADG